MQQIYPQKRKRKKTRNAKILKTLYHGHYNKNHWYFKYISCVANSQYDKYICTNHRDIVSR